MNARSHGKWDLLSPWATPSHCFSHTFPSLFFFFLLLLLPSAPPPPDASTYRSFFFLFIGKKGWGPYGSIRTAWFAMWSVLAGLPVIELAAAATACESKKRSAGKPRRVVKQHIKYLWTLCLTSIVRICFLRLRLVSTTLKCVACARVHVTGKCEAIIGSDGAKSFGCADDVLFLSGYTVTTEPQNPSFLLRKARENLPAQVELRKDGGNPFFALLCTNFCL